MYITCDSRANRPGQGVRMSLCDLFGSPNEVRSYLVQVIDLYNIKAVSTIATTTLYLHALPLLLIVVNICICMI